MPKTAYHSLDTTGTVSSVSDKIDYLLSDFYSSFHDQSSVYPNETASLAYIIATYGEDQSKVSNEIEKKLSAYLGRYFSSVSIVINTSSIEGTGGYKIIVAIEVGQDNKVYQVSHVVVTNGKKINDIIRHNNTGM